MMLRRSAALLAVGGIVLTGCGGDDIPTKSEWTATVRKQIDSDAAKLEGSGIDSAAANKIIDDFLGCVYDKIKDDKDLLDEAASATGGSAIDAVSKKAASCEEAMTKAMTGARTAPTTTSPTDG